jgi:hypothetical protein
MCLRSAIDWFRGAAREEEGCGPGPDDDPAMPDVKSPAAFAAWLRDRDARRDDAAGRPRCRECGAVRKEDDGVMHRHLCSSCDLQWIEDSICWPLIARLGRKGARKALLSLVRAEIGPK